MPHFKDSGPLRPGIRVFSLFLVLAPLILAGSCGEDDPTAPCPEYAVGAFEGTVLAGGVSVEATVGARAASGPQRGHILWQTRTDAQGRYRLAVPAGTYFLEVNPTSTGPGSVTPGVGDTLSVGSSTRHVDLRCGRVLLRLFVPESLEGRTFWAQLANGRPIALLASAEVRQGRLEFLFPPFQDTVGYVGLHTDPYPFHGTTYWLSGVFDRDLAEAFPIPWQGPVTLEGTLDGLATISGTVRGSAQATWNALGKVSAYAAADSAFMGLCRIEDDGSFQCDVFSARQAKVRVEIDRVEQWIGGDSFESARVFDLHPGEQVRDVTVVESGILCYLEGPGNLPRHEGRMVVVDERGRAYRGETSFTGWSVVHNLRPGRYFVYLTAIGGHRGWGSQWYESGRSLAEATPVDVGEGALVPITLHLSPGAAMEGRLLLADGTPVDYGPVLLFDSDLADSATDWIQGRDLGAFTFQGLGDGSYLLAAALGAGGLWWYPGTADRDSALVVEVTGHAPVTGIEWRLP